jgi:hypothetical protein
LAAPVLACVSVAFEECSGAAEATCAGTACPTLIEAATSSHNKSLIDFVILLFLVRMLSFQLAKLVDHAAGKTVFR